MTKADVSVAPPVVAMIAAVDAAHPGWRTWEPETLRARLPHTVSDGDWAVLHAVRLLAQNQPAVETDLFTFGTCMQGLNGVTPDFSRVPVCSAAELTYGWLLAKRFGFSLRISEEVINYLRACMAETGLYAYPDALRMFEPPRDATLCERIRAACDPDLPGPAGDDVTAVQAAKLGDVYRYCAARLEPSAAASTR